MLHCEPSMCLVKTVTHDKRTNLSYKTTSLQHGFQHVLLKKANNKTTKILAALKSRSCERAVHLKDKFN